MALQGVNLPLAFTGQEAIWQKVFKVGFSLKSHRLLIQQIAVLLLATWGLDSLFVAECRLQPDRFRSI